MHTHHHVAIFYMIVVVIHSGHPDFLLPGSGLRHISRISSDLVPSQSYERITMCCIPVVSFVVGGDSNVYECRGWHAQPEKCDRHPELEGASIEIAHIGWKREDGE
jgi:hypothetical protein